MVENPTKALPKSKTENEEKFGDLNILPNLRCLETQIIVPIRSSLATAKELQRLYNAHIKRIPLATTGESLDQIYTKPSVTQNCVTQLGDVSRYDQIREPSVGNGVFLSAVNHRIKMGLGIAPHHDDVIGHDFLNFAISPKYERVLVFGNPPFEHYHALSKA